MNYFQRKQILRQHEISFIMELVDEFKEFVRDSMEQGVHNDYNDHFDFLLAAVNVFQDTKEEEDEGDC